MEHDYNDFSGKSGDSQKQSSSLPSLNLAAALILVALSAAFLSVSAVCYGSFDERLVTGSLCFIVSVVLLSFLFIHWRSPAVVASPLAALGISAAAGADILLAGQAVSLALVVSAVTAISVFRRLCDFKRLILTSLLFFCSYVFITFTGLVNAFGSVSEGLVRIKEYASSYFSDYFAMLGESESLLANLRGQTDVLLDYLTVLLPSVYMIISLVSAWLSLFILHLASRLAGSFRLLFADRMKIPKAFSVLYLAISLISFFSTAFPMRISAVMINLYYVFMILFAGIGFKEIVRSFIRMRSLFAKIMIACFIIGTFLFSWYIVILYLPLALPLISYFGTYRAVKPLPEKKNIR